MSITNSLNLMPIKLNAQGHLDRKLNVAPMMGCTDRHCRYLLRLISPNALIYSEMIVSGALIHGNAAHFLKHQGDEPAALQIGGSNPAELSECTKMIEAAGYQEINLNVGCPSDRVQYGGIGACLMAEPELVAECISAMQSVTKLPVTVKCRIGIDNSDSYEFFEHFVRTLANAGCLVFIVHARKAILKGLSPKENREIPPLKYDYVFQIKKALPEPQFILNGNLHTQDVDEILPKVDGVMYGRQAYNNPWMLRALETDWYQSPLLSKDEVLGTYMDYMENNLAEGVALKYMAKHLFGFYLGHKGARKFRQLLSENMFKENAGVELIQGAIRQSGVQEG